MTKRWVTIIISGWILGHLSFVRGEDTVTAEPQSAPTTSSPERVQIISIGGHSLASHPGAINVLPGEQISFRADVIQAGNACPHPEGCPEGRGGEEFHWSASDRADDSCSARTPESCRDRSAFQPEGNEMIFHIPYAMGRDITIQVSHENLYSSDNIVLHNSHYGSVARQYSDAGYTDDNHSDVPLYPSLAPTGIDEPYAGPYYPYSYWWGPYPYAYRWAGWGGGWGWGWGGPGWTVGIGFGPAWGWGSPYGGWGYYRPGVYGFYRPGGWWRPGYAMVSNRAVWRPGPVVQQRFNQPARPMNYGARPMNYARPASAPHFRRRRWR